MASFQGISHFAFELSAFYGNHLLGVLLSVLVFLSISYTGFRSCPLITMITPKNRHFKDLNPHLRCDAKP